MTDFKKTKKEKQKVSRIIDQKRATEEKAISSFSLKRDEKINQLEKIVINAGIGRLRSQSQFEEKVLPEIIKEMSLITGQKPAPCPAKKSIAGFKIRQGDVVGLKVTLRKKKMKDFLSRLVNIVLPRVKDFHGLDLKNIDQHGNFNIGFREQFVFPEINPEQSHFNFGLQVTIVPKILKRESAIDLYQNLGLPLKGVSKKSKENG